MMKKKLGRRSFLEIVSGVVAVSASSFLSVVSSTFASGAVIQERTDSDSSDQSGRAAGDSDSSNQSSAEESDSSDRAPRSGSDSDSSDQSGRG